MQILRMHIFNQNQSSHSDFEWLAYSLSCFYVLGTQAVTLDGGRLHNQGDWVMVSRAEKSLFGGWARAMSPLHVV